MHDLKTFILKTFIYSVINTSVAIVFTGATAFLYLNTIEKEDRENLKKKINIGTIKKDF